MIIHTSFCRAVILTRSLMLSLIIAFSFNAARAAEQIHCAGCKTEFFLIQKITDSLNQQSNDLSYKPASTGNKKAIELMLEGKINFAFTCKTHWQLAKKFQLDKDIISSWSTVAIAHDPIIVVANPDCKVSNLTMPQLCDIFSGTITNWKDISGADLDIKVGYLDESVESGVVTVFKETSVGENNKLTANATLLKAPNNLGNFCQATPGAIVFMGMNSYDPKYGTIISIDGNKPDVDTVTNGSYPLSVTYYIIYDKQNSLAADKLLAFIATDKGKEITNSMMIAIDLKEIKPKP